MNREGHVKRVYSEDQSTWVDIFRIDRIYVSVNGQAMWLSLNWEDEDNENPQAGRKYKQITIEPPEGQTGQPIIVNSLTRITMSNGGQKLIWSLDNEDSNSLRYTYKRRVSFRSDEGTFSGYASWSSYEEQFNNIEPDDTQYIDTTIIDHFTVSNNGQRTKVTIKNDSQLQLIGNTVPSGGGTIYRLDPFQTIVNVKWEGAKWAVISYSWTSGGGRDLDTRTRMLYPRSGAEMGWSRADSDPPYCWWGSDNTNQGGEETIKIHIEKLRQAFPEAKQFQFMLAAFWYGERGSGTITIRVRTGMVEPEYVGTSYYFPEGDIKLIFEETDNISLQTSTNVDGQLIGVLTTDFATASL